MLPIIGKTGRSVWGWFTGKAPEPECGITVCTLYLDHEPVWGGDGFYCSHCFAPFGIFCQERVICAAVRATDGTIVRGHRHSDAIKTLSGIPGKKFDERPEAQGFVTSLDRFVNRREACQIQKSAGISSKLPFQKAYLGGELYSEDLY